MLYALVKDGAIMRLSDQAPEGDQSQLAPNKARWWEVAVTDPEYDPISEVKDGPVDQVGEAGVTRTYSVRAKNEGELAAMRAAKSAQIEAEFQRRWQLPITYSVGGDDYEFHADQEAVDNVLGVLNAYREAADLNIPMADPRNWTPKDTLAPISITRAELAGLGLAMAARKDALFVVKKTKQGEVAALTDALAIASYAADGGWD